MAHVHRMSTQPASATSIVSGELAHARLAAMHLSDKLLRTAVEGGEHDRRSCTLNNTPGGPGFRAYDRTIRTLREGVQLDLRSPWQAGSRHGLHGIVHESGALVVTVMMGDERTGLDGDALPRSRNPKGSMIQAVVRVQNGQGVFEWPGAGQPTPSLGDQEIWVLLIHSDEEQVRFELSLPTGLDDDDRLCAWRERIILEPIVLPGPIDDLEESEEIDFDIRRRA